MKREPVKSSRIKSVGWEPDTMEIEFLDGAIYRYLHVSKEEFETFMSSPSLGSSLSAFEKRHRYHPVNRAARKLDPSQLWRDPHQQ